MIAATSTMWDTLSWGGETQALIYNPHTGKVIGVNALGVAPTGATPEFFKSKGYEYPPEFGPLAAVTPGTPGGIMVMLAEYGKLSLAEVLAPAIEMADGYPIEAQAADLIERWKDELRKWPESRRTFLVHEGDEAGKSKRVAPEAGEIFRQPDLAATLRKLVEAEAQALKAGKNRKEAIMAAYDRFYKGDIAARVRARLAGSRRLAHGRGSRELARLSRRAGEHQLQGHRGLQAHALGAGPGDAADPEHPRELRPEVDGLQQRALHPHAVPGDESRVRGSRLLLRRFALSAGRADPRPALEGLRARAREADQRRAATIPTRGPAIRIRSRAAAIRSRRRSTSGAR